MPKKIVPVNLYNPHSEPENDKKKHPDVTTYAIPRDFDAPRFDPVEDFEPRLGLVAGGKVYIDNNQDRFGMPIRPLRPIEVKPGPGEYESGYEIDSYLYGMQKPLKHGYINDLGDNRKHDPRLPDVKNPGPALYKVVKEPKKISFLFNPTEKWVQ